MRQASKRRIASAGVRTCPLYVSMAKTEQVVYRRDRIGGKPGWRGFVCRRRQVDRFLRSHLKRHMC